MKKIISVFLAVAMLLSFSACGWETEIVNPNDIVIESEADMEIEPESNIKIEPEPETEIKTESEPEQTESIEEIPESYVKIENGKLSGKIHPEILPAERGGETILKDEFVFVSSSVPEGWKPEIYENEKNSGIMLTMPWDERFENYLFVYKDDGTIFDYFYDYYSWGLKINDHTFNEVYGNFSKGVYIRVDSPSKNIGGNENWFLSSQWFYLLQFDGYVVILHQSVRLNDDYTPFAEHEKACNDFAASIKIG